MILNCVCMRFKESPKNQRMCLSRHLYVSLALFTLLDMSVCLFCFVYFILCYCILLFPRCLFIFYGETERVRIQMGGEVGRNWKKVGEGKA